MRRTTVLLAILLLAGVAAGQTSDLQPGEANVIDVDWLERDGDDITFWVTVYKDTEGREGETDWWQLERLDGTALGRHTVASQPDPQFTTNATFPIPDGVRYIVVRGHDSRYLYGGRAIVIDLGGGGTAQYDQGADGDDLSAPSSGGSSGGETGDGGGVGGNETNTTDDGLVPADPEQIGEREENDTDGTLSNETGGPSLPGGDGSALPVVAMALAAAAALAYLAWRKRRDHS